MRLVVYGQVHDTVKFLLRLRLLGSLLNIHLRLSLSQDRAGGNVFPDIGQLAGNGSSGGHGRRHQMGTATSTLTAFKVTVGGTGTSLLGREDIGVHTQAHGASRLSPIETGIGEDLVKALSFGLLLNQTRPRDNHGMFNVGCNLLASNHLGCCPKIFDTGVCAGTDENLVQLDILHRRTSHETHVLKSALARGFTILILKVIGTRNNTVDRNHILGGGTPGNRGDDILAVKQDGLVVHRTLIRGQVFPVVDSLLPLCTVVLGSQRTSFKIFESGLIRGDHASTCTTFDGHVTHGHPGLHTQPADDRSAEFNDGSGTTSGPNNTNDVEDNILTGDSRRQLAIDLDTHVLTFASDEGLSGKDVLDLTGTNTKGKRAKGTVC